MMEKQSCDILTLIPAFKPTFPQESIGSLILSNLLNIAGYNSKIIRYWEADCELKNYSLFKEKVMALVSLNYPKIVSFYCRCDIYHICIDIAKSIKTKWANIIICFGGPQAEMTAVNTLKSFSFIDYICCGEGEKTIVPFVNSILNGTSVENIPGLVFRNENGNIIANPLPDFLPDDYQSNYLYYSLVPNEVINCSDWITIDVGRGCPFCCTFCSTKTFWKRKFRLRNIHNIVDEIEFAIANYDIQKYAFEHDLFTANSERIYEFCDELLSRGLGISWRCSSRADTIDPYMIEKMKQAGLKEIYFGIETGSFRIQKIIKKNLNLEYAYNIIKYTLQQGISVITSFIYGFPEETEDDISDTILYIHNLIQIGVNKIQVHLCDIMNGTELYNTWHNALIPANHFSNMITLFGYADNQALIQSHPEVFASFFDIKQELRTKLRYLPVFLSCWVKIRRTYGLIAKYYIESNIKIVNMYYCFIKIQSTLLNSANNDLLGSNNYLDSSLAFSITKAFITELKNSSTELIGKSSLIIDVQVVNEVFGLEKDIHYLKEVCKSPTSIIKSYYFDYEALLLNKELFALPKSTSTLELLRLENGKVFIRKK